MEDLSEEYCVDVSVVDVYDIASEIGKECEKIIDRYGADTVTSLMPKVINALEMLELLATRNERENTHLNELKLKISQLENDKLEKAEYRLKFEKELESIEDQWRQETKDLVQCVAKLQEENRKLFKSDSSPNSIESFNVNNENDEAEMLRKLKDNLQKQREDIREKENVISEKSIAIDNLKSQLDRLSASSRELRRKHKSMQNQLRTMCDERADFIVQLQDQQRDVNGLRQRLGLAQKENEDLVNADFSFPANKAIYDLDDPNRPRFTTEELKDILHERNELKAKISDLEDELEIYRPKKITEIDQSPSAEDEDAPVEGPLPYEPDDAPWKKSSSESGIRRFFRKIFSESTSAGSNSFPKRSLSTLSKIALSSTSDPMQY